MRYTTVIDLTELPAVYKSTAARLLYLHMALRAGWHDNDRDLLDMSIRQLAAATGLTLSATRCALALLARYHLIARQGRLWYVRKWLQEQPVTSRPKTARQQKQLEAAAERQAEQAARERQEELERIKRQQLEASGKTPFMAYYEDLQAKAAAGDPDAAKLVERHRATYEAHKANLHKSQTI